DLINACLPFLGRLAEEIVIEQMQLPRVRRAAPDVRDRVGRPNAPFLGRYDAEFASEATSALGESQRVADVPSVVAVVLVGGDTDQLLDGLRTCGPGSPNNSIRVVLFEQRDLLRGEAEDRRAIHAMIPILKEVGLDTARHDDLVTMRSVPVGNLHE